MTRRNDKRNNRHNRQRNNKTEFSPISASMLFGALLSKCMKMIVVEMAKEAKKTPDIHAEGINNEDINNGNATLSKLRIPDDGSAVEYTTPDNFQFFFSEDGRLMVRKKIEGEAETPDDKEDKPITYDDICKKLFFEKIAYWCYGGTVEEDFVRDSYKDTDNCTSIAQAKRILSFNKLQNIAKYLNKGWKPDFTYSSLYTICKDCTGKYSFLTNCTYQAGAIYFKTEELAREAIRLMGEASLNELFNEDW